MELTGIKMNSVEKKIYISICEQIWGCVPVDTNWARTTSIYNDAFNKILNSRKN